MQVFLECFDFDYDLYFTQRHEDTEVFFIAAGLTTPYPSFERRGPIPSKLHFKPPFKLP